MKVKNFIGKSEVLKNSSILIGGTLISQLIPILLQPILRRIFSPEDFGIAAVYLSIVSILSLIASMNYHTTLNLPKEETSATRLLVGCLIISFIFSLLIFVLFFFASQTIILNFKLPSKISHWLYLIPLSVLVNSSHMIFTNWMIRKKAYKELAINKISRRTVEVGFQLGLGKLWNGNGIILGTIIGDIINFFTYFFQFKKLGGYINTISLKAIKFELMRYIHFPKYSLLPNLINVIGAYLPILIINAQFQESITGQFDLSKQVLALPLSLISMSISQVLLQRISQARHDNLSIKHEILSMFKLLLLLTIPGTLTLFFFGEELFTFIFGENWRLAGHITEILVLSYGIIFVISPLTSSFIALERLKLNSLWQILRFLLISTLFLFTNSSFEQFIYIILIIDGISYICYGIFTFKIIRDYEKQINN